MFRDDSFELFASLVSVERCLKSIRIGFYDLFKNNILFCLCLTFSLISHYESRLKWFLQIMIIPCFGACTVRFPLFDETKVHMRHEFEVFLLDMVK
jgi:hypothetical protein